MITRADVCTHLPFWFRHSVLWNRLWQRECHRLPIYFSGPWVKALSLSQTFSVNRPKNLLTYPQFKDPGWESRQTKSSYLIESNLAVYSFVKRTECDTLLSLWMYTSAEIALVRLASSCLWSRTWQCRRNAYPSEDHSSSERSVVPQFRWTSSSSSWRGSVHCLCSPEGVLCWFYYKGNEIIQFY